MNTNNAHIHHLRMITIEKVTQIRERNETILYKKMNPHDSKTYFAAIEVANILI